MEVANAAIMQRRCCSIRRARISTYPTSSRMPDSAFKRGVDGRQVLNGHSRFAIIAIKRTGR